MILVRGIALLTFLLIAAGLILWQVLHSGTEFVQLEPNARVIAVLALIPVVLIAEFLVERRLKGNWRTVALCVAGLPFLPLVAIVAGALSLLAARPHGIRRARGASVLMPALVVVRLAVEVGWVL